VVNPEGTVLDPPSTEPHDRAPLATRRARRAKPPTLLGEHAFGPSLRVRRYQLDNGLSLLVLREPSAPIVSYHTWFRVGSRHETPGKTGQAHLLEHLMFIETESLAEGEFDRLLEAEGGESNAATWTDWTYYYENLPSSSWKLAVKLEAGRLNGLVLAPKRVASEKEVVESERRDRVEDDVDGAVSERLYASVFGRRHPYGWPTIGWMRDIEGFSPADCRRFYRAHYAPNHATIVVAGDVDADDAARTIAAAYGHFPSSPAPALSPLSIPLLRGEKVIDMRWPTPTEKLAIGWVAPAFAERDHAVLTVLTHVLAAGRSARLHVDLVREREIASEVRMSVAPFREASLVDAWVSLREGHTAEQALRALDLQLVRLSKDEVPQAELDKVKNGLELSFLGGLETVPGKAEQIGFSETVVGDPSHAFVRLEEYRSVTPADVRRVARDVLTGAGRTVVRVRRGRA
jgi:zinc protease